MRVDGYWKVRVDTLIKLHNVLINQFLTNGKVYVFDVGDEVSDGHTIEALMGSSSST